VAIGFRGRRKVCWQVSTLLFQGSGTLGSNQPEYCRSVKLPLLRLFVSNPIASFINLGAIQVTVG